ncbi:MAG: hypothetical protein LBK54_11590 [Propionibacteriaceae bacterium]|nr:hypothetical protein [Propionibacteriaceae bacterium]
MPSPHPSRRESWTTRRRRAWRDWSQRHLGLSQFIVFFVLSNGVTVLQLVLMPLVKLLFAHTALIGVSFQVWAVGTNADGSPHHIFDYAAGPLPNGGGGLAYFLAVELTLLVAQVVNFFAQRNITFKADNSVWKAAAWYAVAYVAITLLAAGLQGLYKAPVYRFLITAWGRTGETVADVVTMLINSAISFWVFFPIFKLIFRSPADRPVPGPDPASAAGPPPPAPPIPSAGSGPATRSVPSAPAQD